MSCPSILCTVAFSLVLALAACRPAPSDGGETTDAADGPPAADGGEVWFRDVTALAGIDFEHQSGIDGGFFFPEHVGSGGALFDYDGDGDLDLYLVTSGFHQAERRAESPSDRLLRHEGDGTFKDRTEASGLMERGYGMGAAVGDADNDGDLDLYVSNYGRDTFYRNNGDGTFSDATVDAGLGSERWSTSACFFDAERDGDLDLYVVTYVHHDPPKVCTDQAGRPEYCGPAAFRGVPDLFYRNTGGGSFTAATVPGGLGEVPNKGLGVVCADLDNDGRDDIYVANDGEPNNLWQRGDDGTWEDRGLLLGVASNRLGQAEASMGIGLGDVDGDLEVDLFLAHLDRETNTLYRNLGSGFEDATVAWDVGRESLPYTGFGTALFDAENDGDLDLVIVNGRVRRGPSAGTATAESYWTRYAEPNLFFLNDGGSRFHNASARAGALVSDVEVSRGLLAGDVDRDGAVDLVVTNCNGPARLYHNRLYMNDTQASAHWLEVRAFDAGLGRDALGARIEVSAGGHRQVRLVTSTWSYLTSVEPVVHFGLGAAERFDLAVTWDDGALRRLVDVPADRRLFVVRRPQR